MPTKAEILKRAADEARAAKTPMEKANGLFALWHQEKTDDVKMPLAVEILEIADAEGGHGLAHIRAKLRRYLAAAETRKVDGLKGKARDAQIEKAYAAIEAHPDAKERVTLLIELSKNAEE